MDVGFEVQTVTTWSLTGMSRGQIVVIHDALQAYVNNASVQMEASYRQDLIQLHEQIGDALYG